MPELVRDPASLRGRERRDDTVMTAFCSATPVAGFDFNRLTAMWVPEIHTAITHLREVLGYQTYKSLARNGETMTTVDMVTYAYDQID